MTDIDVLEKLLAAATQGPWDCTEFPGDFGPTAWLWQDTGHAAGDPDAPDSRFGTAAPSDAALIVALRNNAEGMLAELRALRAVAAAADRLDPDTDTGWSELDNALAALDAVRKEGAK